MGNVGIGTTSHTSNLAVQGSSYHFGIASFSNSVLQSNATTPNYFMGNIALGTTDSKNYKLNVDGSVSFSNFVNFHCY